jgi:hypothetical protein
MESGWEDCMKDGWMRNRAEAWVERNAISADIQKNEITGGRTNGQVSR